MYNIITTNDKIQINCKNKKMEDDLVVEFQGTPSKSAELTWDKVVDNCVPVPKAKYEFIASNGVDLYSSSDVSTNTGIWHTNLQTGVITKIYDKLTSWCYFYEDSKGNIYVGTYNKNSGIVHLKDGIATQIYTAECRWDTYYEDTKGNLYALPTYTNSTYSILHIADKVCVKILQVVNMPGGQFIENEYGLYVSVYSTQLTSRLILVNGSDYEEVNGITTNLSKLVKDSKGNVYASASGSSNTYFNIIRGTDVIYTNTTDTYLREVSVCYEDSNDNTYLCSSEAILYVTEQGITQIYAGGFFNTFYTDSKGNLYVLSSSSSSKGLVHLDGETATNIFNETYGLKLYEDSKGNLYGIKEGWSGIVHINTDDLTATKVASNGQHNTFFEASNGDVYITKIPSIESSYIYHLNGKVGTYILGIISCQTIFEKNNKVYVFETEKPEYNANGYELVGTSVSKIKYLEVE